MKKDKKLKEGQFVFVIKGERCEKNPDKYIAVIRRIDYFDSGQISVVEFLGGKRESLKESDLVSISDDEALAYLIDNLIIPLNGVVSSNFSKKEIFLEISEIIRAIIR